MRSDHPGGFNHPLQTNTVVTQGNVFIDGTGEKKNILKNNGYPAPEGGQFVLFDINTINLDRSLPDFVKTVKDVDDCRFSCTGTTDQGQGFSRFHFERNIFQYIVDLIIGKVYLIKLDIAF